VVALRERALAALGAADVPRSEVVGP
jgi:hypothetical protein